MSQGQFSGKIGMLGKNPHLWEHHSEMREARRAVKRFHASGSSWFLVESRTCTCRHPSTHTGTCTGFGRLTDLCRSTYLHRSLQSPYRDTQIVQAACHSGEHAVALEEHALFTTWGVNCANTCPLGMQQLSRTVSSPSSCLSAV